MRALALDVAAMVFAAVMLVCVAAFSFNAGAEWNERNSVRAKTCDRPCNCQRRIGEPIGQPGEGTGETDAK